MITLYFTATGNSLAAAKKIGGELVSIPQAIRNGRYEYETDAIGFVFPTYCCNVPPIVQEFLSKAKLKTDYLFAIATYGNPMGSGGDGNELGELEKYAAGLGYRFDYLNSVLMVDNFVDNFDIQKEIEKLPSKRTDESLEAIRADIAARRSYKKPVGAMGKMLTNMCRGLAKKQAEGKTARKFIVSDACVRCGTCGRVCPRGNITVTDRVCFGDGCEGCYACLHICPKNAIHLKTERSAARWRNPDVSAAELIRANRQSG